MSALHEAAEYVDLSGLSAPRRRPTEFDPERSVADQVGEWLDEAGLTLATLRMKNLRPSGVRINWPDIVMDRDDLAWARMSDELLPPPTADAIVRMDRALCWVMLLDDRTQKIVVNKRLIVHPVSGKFLWEWRKLGKLLGMHHRTAQVCHRTACEVIGKKISLK
ncbi:MAG: DUF6362 family protein [Acetobacter sp.]|jgi:hypothetical protein|nr:DUF6362 family protein [Acetobacter sp.]MCH4060479.1 DUF6362 family protein [Acetobacter sp.]MCH4087419.1 DUF6362 family protein [Acetobacter sp.]MCI1293937.1 DUF6362 family protein [Acetobacter sp.]MCI1320469.1 DUF6362 family protein [Acetobacter sp.]